MSIVFDVETGPLPLKQLQAIVPAFEPPPPPGVFDPFAVKTGRMIDQVKINAKVAAAKKAHKEAVVRDVVKATAAESKYWEDVVQKAALDATTGRVLAIGAMDDKGTKVWTNEDETQLLFDWWRAFDDDCGNLEDPRFCGFNIFGFDLPFLVRRSWKLGVDVATWVRPHGRHWDSRFVDLMQIWGCGVYRDYIKLDTLAAHLGVERKAGDGANFYKLWADDRQAAIDYLKQDLRVTKQVAERMGVL